MTQLPIFYYPTSVLFVDNDEKFLDSLLPNIAEFISFKSLEDPFAALDNLNKTILMQNLPQKIMNFEKPKTTYKKDLKINVRAIHQEIYNPNRFSQISVLVVSYNLPGMDGITLARKTPRGIKKILLTAGCDERLIIDAFNEGILDKFVPKQNPNLQSVFQDAIHELQQNNFQEISENIIPSITLEPSHPLFCLKDPMFINFFRTLIQENKLIEYYLLDTQGSFLFLDKQAKPSWLVVANQNKMDKYYELACAHHAPESVMEPLKEKTKIPFFFSNENHNVKPEKWEPYLHPAKSLKGENLYYYAYIENCAQYQLNNQTIVSFADWLRSNNQLK